MYTLRKIFRSYNLNLSSKTPTDIKNCIIFLYKMNHSKFFIYFTLLTYNKIHKIHTEIFYISLQLFNLSQTFNFN